MTDDELLAAWLRDLPEIADPRIEDDGITLLLARGDRAGPHRFLGTNGGGLQDTVIEEVTGEAWPVCPVHGRHPLSWYAPDWRCGRDGGSWPAGSLREAPTPPVVAVPDDEVRWWLRESGWGVVAHRDGDLFVVFGDVADDGYRELVEGQRVTYRVDTGMQGLLRRAVDVRAG